MKKGEQKKPSLLSFILMGVAMGTAFGYLYRNIPAGIGIAVTLGLALYFGVNKQ